MCYVSPVKRANCSQPRIGDKLLGAREVCSRNETDCISKRVKAGLFLPALLHRLEAYVTSKQGVRHKQQIRQVQLYKIPGTVPAPGTAVQTGNMNTWYEIEAKHYKETQSHPGQESPIPAS